MKLGERPTHHSYAHPHTRGTVWYLPELLYVYFALPLPTKFRFFLRPVDWRIALTIASTFSS